MQGRKLWADLPENWSLVHEKKSSLLTLRFTWGFDNVDFTNMAHPLTEIADRLQAKSMFPRYRGQFLVGNIERVEANLTIAS